MSWIEISTSLIIVRLWLWTNDGVSWISLPRVRVPDNAEYSSSLLVNASAAISTIGDACPEAFRGR